MQKICGKKFLTISKWFHHHKFPQKQLSPDGKSLPAHSQDEAYDTDKNHVIRKVRPNLRSSGKSSHPPAVKVPVKPVYPKHREEPLLTLHRHGIRVIPDKMADQCLWHRRIHRIHGHMISVVSRPAECQLRQIACADDHTTGLICNVHKNLGSLTCLSILVSHIMHFRICPISGNGY